MSGTSPRGPHEEAGRDARSTLQRDPQDVDGVGPAPDEPEVAPGTFRPRRSVGDLALRVAAVAAFIAFVASVLLAVAALLLGAGVADEGAAASVYALADGVSRPVSGIVTLTGEGAEQQNAFLAYGIGSLACLALAFAVPKVARILLGR